jgi:hypothetical protein
MSKHKISGFELSKMTWDIPVEKLGHRERVVLRALADYYGLPKGICPSNETLEAKTGYGESAVLVALNQLEAAGFLASTGRRGGRKLTTRWEINVELIMRLAEKAVPATGFSEETPWNEPQNPVVLEENPVVYELNPVPATDDQNRSEEESDHQSEGSPAVATAPFSELDGLTDSFSETTGKVMSFSAAQKTQVLVAIGEHGRETVVAALDACAKDNDWTRVKSPAAIFLSKLPDYLAVARGQVKRQQERLAAQERRRRDEEWMAEYCRREREQVLADRKKLLEDDAFQMAHAHEI